MGRKRPPRPERHKQDLGEVLEDPETYGVRTQPREGKRRRRRDDEDDDGAREPVPQDVSARILREARAQQEELDAEEAAAAATAAAGGAIPAGAIAAALQRIDENSDEDDDGGGFDDGAGSVWGGDDQEGDQDDVSPEDEAALAAFMTPAALDGSGAAQQRTLADAILARLTDAQDAAGLPHEQRDLLLGDRAGGGADAANAAADDEGRAIAAAARRAGLDARIVEVYRGVGQLLARYASGRVPKAFKIVPSLVNWEDVLQLTEPERWTPHAMYAATTMFVSNLNARMAQRFLALVLLPRVRRDIAEHRRLHFALFQALRKATYKAGAFYKGLLLPLCQSGTCTLREAVVFSSVLKRGSLPVLHSAAALLRLASLPYAGTTSFFIRVLLDKKYALPLRVVDALAAHFCAFADDARAMPVVWHQGLLCFVQRYKHQLSAADRDALVRLTAAQHHHLVSPEVARELEQAVPRDAAPAAAGAGKQAGGGGARIVAEARVAAAAAARSSHVAVEDAFNLPPVPMLDDD